MIKENFYRCPAPLASKRMLAEHPQLEGKIHGRCAMWNQIPDDAIAAARLKWSGGHYFFLYWIDKPAPPGFPKYAY